MKPETTALLGQQVGNIRVVDVLGEGGMGAVYVGFDDKLRRKVALKAIRAEYRLHAEAKARFLREARILSQLDHPYICTVHDFIETEECDFLVLELVKGKSLREAMKDGLSYQQKLSIATQLLEVLIAVHGQGVVHRDLKPENVMITEGGSIKVLDFGLSRSGGEEVLTSSVADTLGLDEPPVELVPEGPVTASSGSQSTYVKTKLGTVIGTLGYMSPEQARGEPATAASDMYSFGLILQELLTGERPFESGLEYGVLVERAGRGETTPVSGLPPDVTALIDRLKALAPGARPSAIDTLQKLRWIQSAPGRRRKRLLRLATWAALLLLTATMTIQFVRASRESQRNRAVSEFLRSIIIGADGPGTSETEIEGVVQLASQLFGERHPVVGSLLFTWGSVLANAGELERAADVLERAADLQEASLGSEHPSLATTYRTLGRVCEQNREYERAEQALAAALEIRRSSDGELSAAFGDLAAELAELLSRRPHASSWKRIDALWSSSIEALESSLGEEDPRTVTAMCLYGVWLVDSTPNDRAIQTLERAVRLGNPSRLTIGDPWYNAIETLVSLHFTFRKYDQLEPWTLIWIEALAERHGIGSDYFTRIYHEWRHTLKSREDDEALELARRVEEFLEREQAGSKAALWVRAKTAAWNNKDYDEASRLFAQLLAEMDGDDLDPMVVKTERALIETLLNAGQLGSARNRAQALVDRLAKGLGPAHDQTLLVRCKLGEILAAESRFDAAEELLTETLRIAAEKSIKGSTIGRISADQLVKLYEQTGNEHKRLEYETLSATLEEEASQAPRNLDFEIGDLGAVPEGWGDHLFVAGVAETTSQGCFSGSKCVKIHDRQGADLIDAWSSIKNCTKCIPAAAYVGKTIVFSAAVRVETRAEQDRAQLWLRVDLEGGRSGFFDNGGQNPIVSGEWQRYQIAGDVSEDAERICLGFMVFGGATAWIDEVRIEQATSSPEYDAG